MKKFFVIPIIFLLIMGCKPEESETPAPDPEEQITGHWQVAAVKVNQQTDNSTDYSEYYFSFSKDKTYLFIEPVNHQEGNWEFIDNGTALLLDKGADREQRVIVLELNEASLHLEFTEESEKTGVATILYELIPCPGDCKFEQ